MTERGARSALKEVVMYAYVYGKKRELPTGFAEFLDVTKSAVLSIDMHRGHLEDSPDCPCPAPRGREIVEPIDAFHDRARQLGVPIIHVESVLRRNGEDDVRGIPSAWRLTFPLYVGDIPNAHEFQLEGSRWTEFVTTVEPNDILVQTKKRLSAFYPTDLDFLLRNLGTRALVINGGFTDCCVLNTAFEGSNLGYRIVVLRDLVRGTNLEMEDAALKMLSLHCGLVVDSDDLLSQWTRLRATAAP
jgi:nicotinamidase-related amidase